MDNHDNARANESRTSSSLRQIALEGLRACDIKEADDDGLDHRRVDWQPGPNGTLRGAVELDDAAQLAIELFEQDARTRLRVLAGGEGIRLLGLHLSDGAGHDPVLLDWRRDRRELLPESTDADTYALAAADFQEVFFKGETPELFFQIVAHPGTPRRVTIELIGLSHLAGSYTAELLAYDRKDRRIDPIHATTGQAVPIVPQILELRELAGRTLSPSQLQLMERCREAHPSTTHLVGATGAWEVEGSLARGTWIVVRLRRRHDGLGNAAMLTHPLKPQADGTYLVERPARQLTGNGKSPHHAEGWLLGTGQINQLADRLVFSLGPIVSPQHSEAADLQWARQETAVSFTRELRRGEFNKTLTNDEEQASAAAKTTVRRERCNQARGRHDQADQLLSESTRRKSEAEPISEPWFTDMQIAVSEAYEAFCVALQHVEPCPRQRVMIHACRQQREDGEEKVVEWAANYFGIGERTLYRKLEQIGAAVKAAIM